MEPKPYNTLLAIARELKLWLTPSRQTYVQLPAAHNPASAVPLWSEEFFTWCFAKFNFENFPAPITYNRVLRQLDEDARAQPRDTVQPSNLRATAVKGGYHIDLGGPIIHLTGKQWTLLPPAPDENRGIRSGQDPAFLRPATNHTLHHPTESTKELRDYLRDAFGIDEEPASKLGQWLELALRPDQPCPTLVLTGELRDEAARAIRNLIDPSNCAMFPFPLSRGEAGWMAVYNRVLAFPIYGKISEFKRTVLKSLANGTFAVRLRQSDKKLPPITEFLSRPLILTADTAPEISRSQITIEIKRCSPLPQQEVLAALFTQMACSLHDEKQSPQRIDFQAPRSISIQPIATLADAPVP